MLKARLQGQLVPPVVEGARAPKVMLARAAASRLAASVFSLVTSVGKRIRERSPTYLDRRSARCNPSAYFFRVQSLAALIVRWVWNLHIRACAPEHAHLHVVRERESAPAD